MLRVYWIPDELLAVGATVFIGAFGGFENGLLFFFFGGLGRGAERASL
jgi:hypothetical protein